MHFEIANEKKSAIQIICFANKLSTATVAPKLAARRKITYLLMFFLCASATA